MTFRKVLMITYHFPPSAAVGGLRLLGFSRHLPKFGWQTEVVAPPTMPWEPDDEALLDQVSTETVIHAVPFTKSRIIRRLAATDSWLPNAWLACQRAIRQQRPDAILTSGPPHHVHLLGLGLKNWHGIPWVADFRDPWEWTVRFRDPFSSPTSVSWWENILERAVIRQSDAIIVNAPLSCETFAANYPEHMTKTVMITNGYDPESFENLTQTDTVTDPAIRIRYSGQIYKGRDPRPFIDALQALLTERTAQQRPIRVDFFGAFRVDAQYLELQAEIRQRGLGGIVSVHREIPHARSLVEMFKSDILLLLDTPGRRIGVSAKLYEYIGSGRPILAMVEPESDNAWVLRQAGSVYRIVSPDDPKSIQRGLGELIDAIENGISVIEPDPGRLNFTRENLTRQLAAVLDRCIGKSRAGSSA